MEFCFRTSTFACCQLLSLRMIHLLLLPSFLPRNLGSNTVLVSFLLVNEFEQFVRVGVNFLKLKLASFMICLQLLYISFPSATLPESDKKSSTYIDFFISSTNSGSYSLLEFR